jgi:twitching motility protein PilT
MNLNDICQSALRQGASDIHLKGGRPPLVRVDGRLIPLIGAKELSGTVVGQLAFDILSPIQREQFKKDLEIDLSIALQSLGRFRVNIFKQRQQVGIALRVIPDTIPSIASMNLPPVLAKLASEERGLILLTGVTGSGKSTTLAAMVEEINTTTAKHIITIEDPIEFSFKDKLSMFSQREIGVDSRSFAAALRAAMRQDPDVILVSEIRDKETMEIALSAAETGHLVLASLHALNAPEAITRVVDFFDAQHGQAVRHMLSGTLKAIISQRLVPQQPSGRVAALEVMVNRGAVTECIQQASRTKEIPDFLIQGTAQYGTQTFDQALFWLHEDEAISKEDALRFSDHPEDLEMRFAGISADEWKRPID